MPCYRRLSYPWGMATRKTSIALGEDDLRAARKAAAAEGTSLSGLLGKLIRQHAAQQAKFEAMERFLDAHAPDFRLTSDARSAIEAEWSAPLKPVRTKRRRRAA